ncbi:DUF3509 domain-containing protein [Pseudomonas sp. BN414]|uniref:DUF3509 domain-containing protein n=1 Tax=Pseudomonas sp. BN414 TaxID=2567888 RepID=UPI002453C6A6|nr:DUF3509 domain-containing protein [Pseudomonas sp. BN414]MDH4565681.1 DUF3509 domain-containing protein [Pseudomonas sp. BN414]
MNLPASAFHLAFPQHQVELQPRPDGSVLLTLRGEKGATYRKAIDRNVLCSEACAERVIHELLREMKLAAGEVVWHGAGTSWIPRDLPTYHGGAITMTKAKTLVQRRKLEHERHMEKH